VGAAQGRAPFHQKEDANVLNRNQMRAVVVSAAVLTGAAACSSSEPELAPSEARISIADDIIAHRTAPLFYASVNGALVAISPDTVESLTITFTEIAYLPEGDGEENEGAWQTLTLDAAVTLDLMALPTEEEGSVVIGAGTVPVGNYSMVRLLVSEGEIVFKGPIALGAAQTFDGGTPYPVAIPSGAQTGLKTDVSFEVTAADDETLNAAYLVFEPGTTFQNVTATGNGQVILAPVLRGPEE
jgi:hypothetical protein